MRRLSVLVALVATFALAGSALAAGGATWKLYSFNGSGSHLQSTAATVGTSGAASFTFPMDTFTGAAYLLSTKVANSGNLFGGTLAATVSITAAPGTEFTNYPGCANDILNPTVGLYFETKATGKTLNASAYWWSSTRVPLSSLVANPTLLQTAMTDGAWTNYNGQTDSAGFAKAATNVSAWGVSFGGDCFYANGVAASNSSAVFTLQP